MLSKKHINRFLACILCIAMALTMAVTPVFAAEAAEVGHDHAEDTADVGEQLPETGPVVEEHEVEPEQQQTQAPAPAPEENNAPSVNEESSNDSGAGEDNAPAQDAPSAEPASDAEGKEDDGEADAQTISADHNDGIATIADTSLPKITITPADAAHTGSYAGENYYCEVPTVEVTDDEGLLSIHVKQEDKDKWYEDYSATEWDETIKDAPTSHTVDLTGKKGIFTITVKDTSENEVSVKFHVEHFMGKMQRSDYPATCTDPSRLMTLYFCADCGEMYYNLTIKYTAEKDGDRYQAPLGHDYGEEITVEEPCGGHGPVKYKVCKRCGDIEITNGGDFNLEDGGHKWQEKTKAATCEKDGCVYDECETCHAIKVKSTTPAHGHNYGTYNDEVVADCRTETNGKRVSHCEFENEGCEKPTRTLTINWSHNYEFKVITEADCTKEGRSGNVCKTCGNISELGQVSIPATGHQYPDNADCTKDVECLVCGETLEGKDEHNMVWKGSAAEGHWQECSNPGCTVSTQHASHTLPENYDCTQSYLCPDCGTLIEAQYEAHSVSESWSSDGVNHWKACTNPGCTYKEQSGSHSAVNDYDCSTDDVCETCGVVVRAKDPNGHDYGDAWYSDASGHWQECQNTDCNVETSHLAHTALNDYDCTTADNCVTCGYTVRPSQGESHNFEGAVYVGGGEDGHYQVCTNAGCNQHSQMQRHTGGEATCVAQARCETCSAPYGAVDSDKHSGHIVLKDRVEATTEAKGYTGNQVCDACNAIVEEGEDIPKLEPEHVHAFTIDGEDDEACWKECSCGERSEYKLHDYETKYDASGHWQECKNCHHQTVHLEHAAANADHDCSTALKCACGYEMEAGMTHVWSAEYSSDENSHWKVCTNAQCSVISATTAHNAVDDNDCETALVCQDCKRVLKEAETHQYGTAWYPSKAGHYHTCENQGCNAIETVDHVPSADDHNCATAVTCTICNYEITPAQEHSFAGAIYVSNGNGYHYRECTNPDCTFIEGLDACSGGVATCIAEAVCKVCLTPYGEKNAENHVEGHTIKNFKQPTVEAEGYSGDIHCAGCDELLQRGDVLNRLDPEHEHTFTVKGADTTGCWLACDECGYVDPDSYKPHDFSGDWQYDSTGHYKVCANGCGTKSTVEVHSVEEDDYDCTTGLYCDVCGYEFSPAQSKHALYEGDYTYDATGHWYVCQNEHCTYATTKVAHVVTDDGDCETPLTCSLCGFVVEAAQTHVFSNSYQTDGENHWKVCMNEGCKVETKHDAHTGGEATCSHKAVCYVCDTPYGELDAENHKDGSILKGVVAATTSTDGYTGDLHCLGCDAVLEEGHVVPAISEDHIHAFGDWQHDSLSHWKVCVGCEAVEDRAGHELEEAHDDNGHWAVCKVCGYESEVQEHSFADGKCTVCGQEDENYVPPEKRADYAAVDAAINSAEGKLGSTLYTEESLKNLQAAVDGVTRSLSVDRQAEVDAMAKAIEDAIAALEYKPADLTALQSAIAKAEALKAEDYDDFSAVKTALEAAKALEGKKDIDIRDQADIDAAAKALEDAVAALAKPGVSPDPEPTDKPEDPSAAATPAPGTTGAPGTVSDQPKTGDDGMAGVYIVLAFLFILSGSTAVYAIHKQKQSRTYGSHSKH